MGTEEFGFSPGPDKGPSDCVKRQREGSRLNLIGKGVIISDPNDCFHKILFVTKTRRDAAPGEMPQLDEIFLKPPHPPQI